MRIRYLEWWNTRCEVSGFMFIHLFLQSLCKDTLLYFFYFFFFLFCSLSSMHQMNAMEMGLLFWKPLFGFLRLQTNLSRNTLAVLGLLSVSRRVTERAWRSRWALSQQGRAGRARDAVSAWEVTAEIAWVVSKSAWDRFCNVVIFLQHQQAVLAEGQDLVLWAEQQALLLVEMRGCWACSSSRISEMWGNRV